jgi:hypothetical protein
MDHGFAGLDEGGKVEDAVEGLSESFGGSEKVFKSGPVCQLSLDKFHARGQKIAPAVAQVVKNDGLMAIFGQQLRHCSTNVPRAACNQYLHKKLPFPEHFGLP